MKIFSVFIIFAIVICTVLIFLFTGDDSQETINHDKSVKNTKPAKHGHTDLNQVVDSNQDLKGSDSKENIETDSINDLLVLLNKAIDEGDWQEAKSICDRLGKRPESFDILVEILLDNVSMEENDVALRWRAACILGMLGNEKAIPVFEQAFPTENAVDVRSNIVLALGMFNSPQTKPLLETIFNRDSEDKGIRQSAAQYLAKLPGGIEFLSDTLNSDCTAEEKRLAVEGLTFSANKQSGAAALTDFLEDRTEDGILRRTAVKALGTLAVPDSADTLITLLQNDSDFRVRNASAQALPAFGSDDKVIEALRNSLHGDKNSTVRSCAAQALGILKNSQVIADLKEALKRDSDRVVRVRIVEALGIIGGGESIRILKEASKSDPSPHVRSAAIQALANLQN